MTPNALWALAITSVAVSMVTLDNLVVTTAIPVIRQDLHAGLSGLQWTVNAYTLTFAVLLMTGAALGDRFERRRLLAIASPQNIRRTSKPPSDSYVADAIARFVAVETTKPIGCEHSAQTKARRGDARGASNAAAQLRCGNQPAAREFPKPGVECR